MPQARSVFPVVTLCGSMRFYPEILAVAQTLTDQGWIVLAPFVQKGQGSTDVEMLDAMHLTKIDMASRICVIATGAASPQFYVGESTAREMTYARDTGKGVYYWTEHFGMMEDE